MRIIRHTKSCGDAPLLTCVGLDSPVASSSNQAQVFSPSILVIGNSPVVIATLFRASPENLEQHLMKTSNPQQLLLAPEWMLSRPDQSALLFNTLNTVSRVIPSTHTARGRCENQANILRRLLVTRNLVPARRAAFIERLLDIESPLRHDNWTSEKIDEVTSKPSSQHVAEPMSKQLEARAGAQARTPSILLRPQQKRRLQIEIADTAWASSEEKCHVYVEASVSNVAAPAVLYGEDFQLT